MSHLKQGSRRALALLVDAASNAADVTEVKLTLYECTRIRNAAFCSRIFQCVHDLAARELALHHSQTGSNLGRGQSAAIDLHLEILVGGLPDRYPRRMTALRRETALADARLPTTGLERLGLPRAWTLARRLAPCGHWTYVDVADSQWLWRHRL